ncbi:MAG TPA: SpoIIE family protein phosphatase [Phycisphaerae bacterium]|nr:SpoIIE family protein phosphatase [Phycisphaerae bacterium]
MASLQIHYLDRRKPRRIEISRNEAVIGRDASCDVPLEDASTSRRHARIFRDANGAFWIEDLRSKNGTLLNGRPVTTSPVAEGDQIGIGGCVLTILADSKPAIVLSDGQTDTRFATSAWGSQQRLDLPQRRLEKLYELNARLTGRFDRDDLLGEVVDICVELLRFERAGIAVWAGDPHPPQWVRLRNLRDDPTAEFRISRSLVNRSLHNAERILVTDTADAEVDPTASMISNNIRSAMCVPMEYLQQVRGVIYGDRISSSGGYTKEDIDFFAALGRLGAMGLANVQLVEEMRRRQQVEIQLQWARQIQSQLFPPEPLVKDGLTIDALNDPGQKISGDYYDYFLRPDGLVTVVIADVSGKGIPASLLMANLQAGVHLTLVTETDLVRGVEALNELVCGNVSEARFITAIFGLLDPASGRLTYVNAGHPGPYLLHADRAEKLNPEPSLPLGIEKDFQYAAGTLDFGGLPATVFLYTDGVPEAENEQGKQYGDDRLAAALQASLVHGPTELMSRIRRSIKQFTRSQPPSDDITMLAIRLEA